jgi:hypothetical protein
MRSGVVIAACLLSACGRLGFGEELPTTDEKIDAAPIIDADPTIDAPIGMGSYGVTEMTTPYTLLDSAEVVPGFVPGDDEGFHPLPLPFTFTFYGIAYDTVSVSMNGYVSFGAPVASTESYVNDCPLDETPPDAMIASFWDDLFASKMIMPFGTLRYAITGTAPDRAVEIEWHDVDAYYHAGSGNNSFSQGIRITQKIVLHESGVIDLHYGPRSGSTTAKDCGTDRYIGCSATVGLRAPSNSVRQMIQCGNDLGVKVSFAPLADGRLIRFTPL